jgi:hypothetical protein
MNTTQSPVSPNSALEKLDPTRRRAAEVAMSEKKYLDWAFAGGPNECAHGYAAGIPCPKCDALAEEPAVGLEPTTARAEEQGI